MTALSSAEQVSPTLSPATFGQVTKVKETESLGLAPFALKGVNGTGENMTGRTPQGSLFSQSESQSVSQSVSHQRMSGPYSHPGLDFFILFMLGKMGVCAHGTDTQAPLERETEEPTEQNSASPVHVGSLTDPE